MRHGAGADLAFVERLFHFVQFSHLQRNHFMRDFAHGCRNHAEQRGKLGNAIACGMPSNAWHAESENFHHPLLYGKSLLRDGSQSSDRARELPDQQARLALRQALLMSFHFCQ